jgi:hypothetical protein
MPLPQWALALADSAGKSGGHQAVLATVTSLPELDERALVVEAQAGSRAGNLSAGSTATSCGWR